MIIDDGSDNDKVEKLPVRFKNPIPEDRTLVFPYEVQKVGECDHYWGVTYVVNEREAEVECGKCGTKLNPMWVLSKLCQHDHRYHDARKTYQEEMKRLSERKRTKCDHCGQMTRISRK